MGECFSYTGCKCLNFPRSITVCEGFFGLDSFGSIPEIDGPATDTSQTFIGTSGAVLLTELLLMESRTGAQLVPLPFLIKSAVCTESDAHVI